MIKYQEYLKVVTAFVFLVHVFSHLILTMLNILNGLVHLSILTKPFIIFRQNFKIDTDKITNSADYDRTARMSLELLRL
jgi:hypothetical protein